MVVEEPVAAAEGVKMLAEENDRHFLLLQTHVLENFIEVVPLSQEYMLTCLPLSGLRTC